VYILNVRQGRGPAGGISAGRAQQVGRLGCRVMPRSRPYHDNQRLFNPKPPRHQVSKSEGCRHRRTAPLAAAFRARAIRRFGPYVRPSLCH
jgi:hypothetical protein